MGGGWGSNFSLFHTFPILQKTIQVLFQLSTGLGLQSTKEETTYYKPAGASSTLEQHSLGEDGHVAITLASKFRQGLQDTEVCAIPVPLL